MARLEWVGFFLRPPFLEVRLENFRFIKMKMSLIHFFFLRQRTWFLSSKKIIKENLLMMGMAAMS